MRARPYHTAPPRVGVLEGSGKRELQSVIRLRVLLMAQLPFDCEQGGEMRKTSNPTEPPKRHRAMVWETALSARAASLHGRSLRREQPAFVRLPHPGREQAGFLSGDARPTYKAGWSALSTASSAMGHPLSKARCSWKVRRPSKSLRESGHPGSAAQGHRQT